MHNVKLSFFLLVLSFSLFQSFERCFSAIVWQEVVIVSGSSDSIMIYQFLSWFLSAPTFPTQRTGIPRMFSPLVLPSFPLFDCVAHVSVSLRSKVRTPLTHHNLLTPSEAPLIIALGLNQLLFLTAQSSKPSEDHSQERALTLPDPTGHEIISLGAYGICDCVSIYHPFPCIHVAYLFTLGKVP